MIRQTIVLIVLDGWGIGKRDESNPIHVANLETMPEIEKRFPVGALQASGIAVGLPWEEVGNSEVGHLTLGAGKILYQHLPKISIAIDDGSFFKNPELGGAADHVRKNKSALHLAGLLTSGTVHAATKHVVALLDFAKREKLENVYLHIFTDGKDSPPRSALKLITELHKEIERMGKGIIQSFSGRYYAMDRDNHWDRTARAYRAMTSEEPRGTVEEAIKKTRDRDLDDEFIEPVVVGDGKPICSGDAVIFWNFREDSMRQIVRPFLDQKFDKFPSAEHNTAPGEAEHRIAPGLTEIKNLFVATMTSYEDTNGARVIFPKDAVENPLGKVISDAGKTQLRVAETEKYAHVTYFFNGLREAPYKNEFRVLVPSRGDVKKEDHPEMMASAITDRVLLSLSDGGFDFILANYANGDVISHTGVFDAAVMAVKTVDKEIGRLVRTALQGNHILVITSDHGNAEALINLQTGEEETQHDPNPVPIYIVGKEFEGRGKRLTAGNESASWRIEPVGLLSDVAPTILALLKLPKPAEMTGQNLLEQLI